MKIFTPFKKVLVAAILFGAIAANGQVTTFEYTGGMQTYVVPVGITTLEMDLYGASGFGNLGFGGRVTAELSVTPGETLNIYVGGAGTGTTGGYNGGGNPGSNTSYGGGGGASDVRQGGAALTDRIIVAGGGGGSGSNCGLWTAEGGHGGGLIGQSGCLYSCSDCQYTGSGGSQVAGGIAGPTAHGSCGGNNNGTLGNGGYNTGSYGTGGGGGYYGGGSGCFEGAGGGSSYTHPDAVAVAHEVGVRDGNGQIILTVICTPLTTVITSISLCYLEELTITATSENDGVITWDGGVINGVAFMPEPGLHTYTATSDSDLDCGYSVDIEVFELPIVTASADETEICEGELVTFTGGGALTYDWFPLDVTDGLPYEVPETGTFTVAGTDINGCINVAEIDVTVHALPTVVANIDESEICIGETFTFTGSGATAYTWDMGVTDGAPFEPAGVGTSFYTVTGTDDNGCQNTASVSGTVYALPIVTASASESETCFGYDVTFNGGGATSYVWDFGVVDDTPTPMTIEGTTTYTVVGTDDNGCDNTASVDVNVLNEIAVTYVLTDEIGGGDGAIDITVTGGAGPYTFDWNTDESGDFDDAEDLSDLIGGVYLVVVKDQNGCTTEVTIDLTSQLGIEVTNASLLSIYPNPTSSDFSISMNSYFTYEILNTSGQLVLIGQANDQEIVSMNDVENGIYFVKVTVNDRVETIKLIKH